MTDEEREQFIQFIAQNPTKGVIIEGTGGIRKIRWAAGSRGKSGGVRVIYYHHSGDVPIFLLTVYSKSRKTDLTQAEKHVMRKLVKEIILTYTTKKST